MSGGGTVVAVRWLDRMLAFWSPGWTLGGCTIAAVAALAARRRLARATGLSTTLAAAWVLGAGAILSVTLAPRSRGDRYYVFGPVDPRCDVVPAPDDMVGSLITADGAFNLALLLPLGWICAAASIRGARNRMLVASAAVPVLVEVAQYAATDLHRVCQGLDASINWLGLVVGYALGRSQRWRRELTRCAPSAGQSPSTMP